jgi:hypothetical protein
MEYVLVLVGILTIFVPRVLLVLSGVLLVLSGMLLVPSGMLLVPDRMLLVPDRMPLACRNANTAIPSTTTNAAARPATFLMRYLGDTLRLGDIAASTLADPTEWGALYQSGDGQSVVTASSGAPTGGVP